MERRDEAESPLPRRSGFFSCKSTSIKTVTTLPLQNIRTRILRGVGIDLSFGRVPGSLSNKYMLIDGEKVMFGCYR